MNSEKFQSLSAAVRNRSWDVSSAVDLLLDYWSYDLESRKPGPAYTADGVFRGSSVDMICYLSELAERGAVVIIPEYAARTAGHKKEGEHVISHENRRGKVLGVVANKDFFSFSIRIEDMNVMTTDTIGAPRTFMIQDYNGEWYDGWRELKHVPTAEENAYLTKWSQWKEDGIVSFNNLVEPNRWSSFFGRPYWLAKLVMERLKDEVKSTKAEVNRLRAAGLRLGGGSSNERSWPKSTKTDDGVSTKFETLEAKVLHDGFIGEFPRYEDTRSGLRAATDRLKFLKRSRTTLLVHIRATEFAFYKLKDAESTFPSHMQGSSWSDYQKPKSPVVWSRLDIDEGYALIYRVYKKSKIVSTASAERDAVMTPAPEHGTAATM